MGVMRHGRGRPLESSKLEMQSVPLYVTCDVNTQGHLIGRQCINECTFVIRRK